MTDQNQPGIHTTQQRS